MKKKAKEVREENRISCGKKKHPAAERKLRKRRIKARRDAELRLTLVNRKRKGDYDTNIVVVQPSTKADAKVIIPDGRQTRTRRRTIDGSVMRRVPRPEPQPQPILLKGTPATKEATGEKNNGKGKTKWIAIGVGIVALFGGGFWLYRRG